MTSPKRKNGSTVIRLVVSFWKDGKVKNRIIKTLGQSKEPKIIEHYKETARRMIEEHKKGFLPLDGVSEKIPIDLCRFFGQQQFNVGFEDIFGASYERLGFLDLIRSGRLNKSLNKVLRSFVLMRIFSPASKLRSCCLLEEFFNERVSHKQVLFMMDHLSRKEEEIRERIFHSVVERTDKFEMLLFDVTTLYFESVGSDDLRDFGYSKDGKFNEVQVVLAVLANQEGLPVAYEVFPGCTAETKTMKSVLESFVRKHKVKRVRVVADRAMFSDNNFSFFEDLKAQQVRGEYVVSCPLKKLPVKIKGEILDFKRKQVQAGPFSSSSHYEFSYKNRKVLVSYSEWLRLQDEKKRRRLLDRLNNLCKEGKIAAHQVVKNTGYRRYLKTLKGSVEIDEKKIFKDSLWDGLYGVCYNIRHKEPEEILKVYRSLWKIEELFRINKHTLRMRPVYHRLSRRIKAHLLICFLAYTVLRYTEIELAKKGLFFSPRELIDILKKPGVFVIQDKLKKPHVSYCVPKALSKQAKQIYAIFGKDYPKQAYKMS